MNLFLLQTRGGGITGVTLLHFGNGVDEQAQRTRPNSVSHVCTSYFTDYFIKRQTSHLCAQLSERAKLIRATVREQSTHGAAS